VINGYGMRYFITLSFDGTDYCGWQRQPHSPSVQQTLEEALSTVLRSETEVVGAGRTDAGVHAKMMVAHFDTEASVDNLKYRLNRLLPNDIAIAEIRQVSSDMHARFSAKERTYHYYVNQEKSPFLLRFSTVINYHLDYDKMNEAAKVLMDYEDFGAFCKSHTDVKTTLCTVSQAVWQELGDGRWVFVITANRFLRNMVRAIVGTLIEVGRDRITVKDFCNIIESGQRTQAGDSVAAKGLFLWDIKY